jgi:hypothetical protein
VAAIETEAEGGRGSVAGKAERDGPGKSVFLLHELFFSLELTSC